VTKRNPQPKAASSAQLRQQVEDLRKELITEKMQVLELQDRLRENQTDQSNAVALLGQAELLLEGKIEYILRIDQALNARIHELEEECDRKSAEIENRGQAITELEARDTRHREERDAVIADLNERLEQANQEINKAHEVARGIDQQRAEQVQALAQETARHQTTLAELDASRADGERLNRALAEMIAQLKEREATLAEIQSQLAQTIDELNQARDQLQHVQDSALWKLGRPWRALFGPKL
jgi:chromosome segregation ATPase